MEVKSLLRGLLLISLIMSSYSYVYRYRPGTAKSPDHEGYCIHTETNSLIKQNDFILTPQCEEISCHDDYGMTVSGCGTFQINDPNCLKFERDYSKPYPVCCSTFICVEFSNKNVDLNNGEGNSLK